MLRYTLKRLLQLIPTTLGVLLLTFLLFHVVGGSPAEVILGQRANADSIAAFNARYGYDKPLFIGSWSASAGQTLSTRLLLLCDSQFFHYLGRIFSGDFGESSSYGMRVADVLKSGIGPSLAITTPILFGGTILALMLAMIAAVHRGRTPDRMVLFGSTLLMSINYVVWILAGQFFLAFRFRLFPIWGFEGITYLFLPVMIGILSGLGRDIRYFRTVFIDELDRPYIRTALSESLPHHRVFWGHLFPNAFIPIVTYVSLSIPYLFTGSLLLESFFGIPGLGGVTMNAVNSADVEVIRAVVILGALLYQVVNLITDLLYAVLDPRVRISA